mmetsp:Transcript_39455/g.85878  ORF Transcript_39455/g.85878 Transcript_39455/m.85878 type:complete len:296 (-) Transcript_39455:318-1205(-)
MARHCNHQHCVAARGVSVQLVVCHSPVLLTQLQHLHNVVPVSEFHAHGFGFQQDFSRLAVLLNLNVGVGWIPQILHGLHVQLQVASVNLVLGILVLGGFVEDVVDSTNHNTTLRMAVRTITELAKGVGLACARLSVCHHGAVEALHHALHNRGSNRLIHADLRGGLSENRIKLVDVLIPLVPPQEDLTGLRFHRSANSVPFLDLLFDLWSNSECNANTTRVVGSLCKRGQGRCSSKLAPDLLANRFICGIHRALAAQPPSTWARSTGGRSTNPRRGCHSGTRSATGGRRPSSGPC